MRTRNLILAAGLMTPLALTTPATAGSHVNVDWQISIGSGHSCNHRCNHMEETVEYDWVQRPFGRVMLRHRTVWHNRYYDTYEYGPWQAEMTVCGPHCTLHHHHRYHVCNGHCRHPHYTVTRTVHARPAPKVVRRHGGSRTVVVVPEHRSASRPHFDREPERNRGTVRRREVRPVPGRQVVKVEDKSSSYEHRKVREAKRHDERQPVTVVSRDNDRNSSKSRTKIKVQEKEQYKTKSNKNQSSTKVRRSTKRSVRTW